MPDMPLDALGRALVSLEGLSVGDAFGECYFGAPETTLMRIEERALRAAPWHYTDDTEMALSVVGVLRDHAEIDQGELAQRFADAMTVTRGYGAGAYKMLTQPDFGSRWRHYSRAAFQGKGSFGNGAAMRAAPIGAYFAGDNERVIVEATKAAEVTHAHEEGIASGVAVAVGASLLAQRAGLSEPPGRGFIEAVRDATQPGYSRKGLEEALTLATDATIIDAAKLLGNGSGVSGPDTVPLCVWVASRWAHDYAEALWQTVTALGDRDTTCAIVGGMVAMQVGLEGIPQTWRESREPIPNMMLALEMDRHFFGEG